MEVFILDPGIPDNNRGVSPNLGDRVIQKAVTQEINSIFDNPDIGRASTHVPLPSMAIERIKSSDKVFVGGSNLLGNVIFRPKACWWWKQWKISIKDAKQIQDAILFGVGWRQYEGRTGCYTKKLIKTVLSNDYIHSVRDRYTKAKLESIGIKNVINTGCPTLWPLADYSASDFPKEKADNVLTMITDYRKKPKSDMKLLQILCRRYRKTYLWPQGRKDREYVEKFDLPVVILERTFRELNELINSVEDLDYVGTRLHGGIHCLLAKKRVLILRVDNRATEISKNRGLRTIERDSFEEIEKWIDGPTKTEITIDGKAIEKWKSQFVH